MKTETVYTCEICGNTSPFPHVIKMCEAQGAEKAVAKIGDIVTLHAGFGWFDGDVNWVTDPRVLFHTAHPNTNCFCPQCTFSFYYVVTFVDQAGHTLRYHVATRAMTEGSGYAHGWTRTRTHYTPVVVTAPPAIVVEQSKDLLFKMFRNLVS
jgi:hypothetical protein